MPKPIFSSKSNHSSTVQQKNDPGQNRDLSSRRRSRRPVHLIDQHPSLRKNAMPLHTQADVCQPVGGFATQLLSHVSQGRPSQSQLERELAGAIAVGEVAANLHKRPVSWALEVD